MKYLLVYYTGTYNTRFLTDEISKKLVEGGNTVDKVEINKDTPVVSTEGYDFIGFSYPIYGFNSPLAFDRYVKKLKYTKGQKYFIYKNSGETLGMNNASSRTLIRIMKRRKAVLAGEYHFVMPYNIHFKYDIDFVREILEKDQKLIKIMIHNLENGVVEKIKSKWIYNFAAFFVAIVKVAGNINSFLYKVEKDKCINCMKCVKECPEKNIYVKGDKIKFHHHCDMCMRCSFFCPTNAIKIGFLDWWGWKVNGDYKLAKLNDDKAPIKPYITEDSKGFYKCFIKTFNAIDKEYERLFGCNEQALEEVAVTKE